MVHSKKLRARSTDFLNLTLLEKFKREGSPNCLKPPQPRNTEG